MRRAILPLSLIVASAVGGRGLALAPCPDSCHLQQGTPILLVDEGTLLMRRCDRVAETGLERTCVIERLDLAGRVLERLPPSPRIIQEKLEFRQAYLDGHTLVEVSRQHPWDDLLRPHPLLEIITKQRLTLSLAKSVLTCTAPGLPVERRDFGCEPINVVLYATLPIDRARQHPVVALGTCDLDAHTKHEVVAVCTAAASRQK